MRCTGLVAGFVAVVGISLAGAANAAVSGSETDTPFQASVADEGLIVLAAAWDNRPSFGELLNHIKSKAKKRKKWRGRFAEPSYGHPDEPLEDEIDDVLDPTVEVIDAAATVEIEIEVDDPAPDSSPTPSDDELEECRLTQAVCAE
jgi:hypothetical protein